jgi:hypothetical protein
VQLAEGVAEQRRSDAGALQVRCTDLEQQLAEAEQKVVEGEEVRRKLHNTIQARAPCFFPVLVNCSSHAVTKDHSIIHARAPFLFLVLDDSVPDPEGTEEKTNMHRTSQERSFILSKPVLLNHSISFSLRSSSLAALVRFQAVETPPHEVLKLSNTCQPSF